MEPVWRIDGEFKRLITNIKRWITGSNKRLYEQIAGTVYDVHIEISLKYVMYINLINRKFFCGLFATVG